MTTEKRIKPLSTQTLFYFITVALVLADWMQSSLLFQNVLFIVEILKYLAFGAGFLSLYSEYRSDWKNPEVFKIAALMILMFITCVRTHNMSYLLIVLFIVTSRSIDIDSFIEINLKLSIVCAAFQIGAWLLNCFIDLGFPVFANEWEHRIGFLYVHPNIAALKIGWTLIMWFWLKWGEITKVERCIAIAAITILYLATGSDSCLILYVFLAMEALKKNELVKKLVLFAGKFIFPIAGIVFFVLSRLFVGYGFISKFGQFLDVFFSKRFAMAHLAIKENGITLLGQSISMKHDWEGMDTLFNFGDYTIDCLYIYFFVVIGLVWFAIISFGFYSFLKKNKSYKYAVVIVIFSLYAMIELHCLYPPKCFALLLLKDCLFDGSSERTVSTTTALKY